LTETGSTKMGSTSNPDLVGAVLTMAADALGAEDTEAGATEGTGAGDMVDTAAAEEEDMVRF
jgi:hypothetical protein